MSFSGDLAAFKAKTDRRLRRVFVRTVTEAHRSITAGSPLTGAPGQPVATGTLRNSYQMSWDSPTTATVASNLRYARTIEDGARLGKPLVFKSKVGGHSSIRLTVAGFARIVDHAVSQEDKP